MFLHAGVIHFVGNALMAIRIGVYLEESWGRWQWLLVYIATGVYATLCSCVMLPDYIGVGASGAIMGLVGAWFVDICLSWEGTPAAQVKPSRVTIAYHNTDQFSDAHSQNAHADRCVDHFVHSGNGNIPHF